MESSPKENVLTEWRMTKYTRRILDKLKRPLRGVLRQGGGQDLRFQSGSVYRKHEAAKKMAKGSHEPSTLFRPIGQRKSKHEASEQDICVSESKAPLEKPR